MGKDGAEIAKTTRYGILARFAATRRVRVGGCSRLAYIPLVNTNRVVYSVRDLGILREI